MKKNSRNSSHREKIVPLGRLMRYLYVTTDENEARELIGMYGKNRELRYHSINISHGEDIKKE